MESIGFIFSSMNEVHVSFYKITNNGKIIVLFHAKTISIKEDISINPRVIQVIQLKHTQNYLLSNIEKFIDLFVELLRKKEFHSITFSDIIKTNDDSILIGRDWSIDSKSLPMYFSFNHGFISYEEHLKMFQ